jgi:hypothetical protein
MVLLEMMPGVLYEMGVPVAMTVSVRSYVDLEFGFSSISYE